MATIKASSSFDSLVEWITSNGASVDALEIVSSSVHSHDRGLRSRKSLQPGDLIVSIPHRLIITPQAARKHCPSIDLALLPENLHPDLAPHSDTLVLILFLLLHMKKGKGSFYADFIASWPQSYTTPINWTPDELDLLKGTPLYPFASQVIRELKENHQQLNAHLTKNHPELLPELIHQDEIAYADFAYVMSTLDTRAFKLNIHGEDTVALIPFIDMANHSPYTVEHFDKVFDTESDAFHMILSKDMKINPNHTSAYAPGDVITPCYGPLSNWQLIQYYGFAMANNPFDTVDIILDNSEPHDDQDNQDPLDHINEANPQDEMRRLLIMGLGEDVLGLGKCQELKLVYENHSGQTTVDDNINKDKDKVMDEEKEKDQKQAATGRFVPPQGILPTLRLMALKGKELENLTIHNYQSILGNPVGQDTEKVVWQSLISLLQGTKSMFGTVLYQNPSPTIIRQEIFDAVQVYKDGQIKILDGALMWAEENISSVRKRPINQI